MWDLHHHCWLQFCYFPLPSHNLWALFVAMVGFDHYTKTLFIRKHAIFPFDMVFQAVTGARKTFITVFFPMFLTAHPVWCNICAIPPYLLFEVCLWRMLPATLGPRCAFLKSSENLSVPTSRFSRHECCNFDMSLK